MFFTQNSVLEFDPADCELVQESLDAYVEAKIWGDVLSSEYNLIEQHIPACMDCAAEYLYIWGNFSSLIKMGLPKKR
jgi:hypothetical protein